MTTQEKPLLPVYLFNGDDEFKRESLLKRLLKRIEGMADLSFNSQTFQGSSLRAPEELIAACDTPPFAAPVRLVVVQDAEKMGKATQEALTAYLEHPNETTVLVLTTQKLAANTRLFKAIKKVDPKAVIDCASLKRSELPALVRNMALAHKVTISPDAAPTLIELVGTSTVNLNTELSKLASYVIALGRDTISRGDVKMVVTRTAETRPWDLVNALTQRDALLCLKLMARMPTESPHALLALCVMRIRDLITVKALIGRGENNIAAALKKQDWQVRDLRQGAGLFKREELLALLRQAAGLEQQMKSGGNPDLLFESWLLKACTVHT
jgi:DNA polymerase-3 subunit delta